MDGLNRTTFEEAINHVFLSRFEWDVTVADVVTNEYTDWRHVNDAMANRNQYLEVSLSFQMIWYLTNSVIVRRTYDSQEFRWLPLSHYP